MSAIRFQRMLDIPGVLLLLVRIENGTYVADFMANKKQNACSFQKDNSNIISITYPIFITHRDTPLDTDQLGWFQTPNPHLNQAVNGMICITNG